HAAVLHAIGTVPRYEEFAEPVLADQDGEVLVHVHAAALKPVDKQLAGGDSRAALEDWQGVLQIDPLNVNALNNITRVKMEEGTGKK
ncbi:MAG TPA: hypothetical protein VJ873_11680, partial [bacterium]|nr:hypothetical protein [bacterium]